jgi:hypothetical protein
MNERDIPVQPGPHDDLVGKLPDPYLMREFWLETVQPVERRGKLDSIKPLPVKTKKQKQTAIEQNYYLTKRSFGMPVGYERIDWSKKGA